MARSAPTSSPAAFHRPVVVGWSRRQWLAGTAAALAAAGCGKMPRFDLGRAKGRRGELKLYTWAGYFPPDLLADFTRETGWVVDPDHPTYSSNAELMRKLVVEEMPCDLIMPSAFQAKTLWDQSLLMRLDHAKIAGLPLATAAIYNPDFDLNNDYIVPYIWASTGIGYDSNRVVGLPKSWAALFRLPPPPRMPNELIDFRPVTGITVLDDPRFTLGSALIARGRSPNTRIAAEIDDAVEVLKQAPITRFDTNGIALNLGSGASGISMAWTADVTNAMLGATKEDGTHLPPNKNVRIALPREGSIVFRDSFAIPARADNVAGAHEFINFLLRPINAARVTNYSSYATTVDAARAYVDRFILNGPSYFIHPAGKNKWLQAMGEDEMLYAEAWAKVKRHFGHGVPGTPPGGQPPITTPEPKIVTPKLNKTEES